MDYEKLCQESLDNIMKAIRMENQKIFVRQEPVQNWGEFDKIKRDAELEYVDASIAAASVGTQIGQKKAPMYKRSGLARKVARLMEAVYLRIAELTNRDLRSFAAAMIDSVRIIRSKIERLFLNDQILEDNLQTLNSETEAKLANLEQTYSQMISDLQEQIVSLARKNDALSRTLETQSSVISELRSQNAQMLSGLQEQIASLTRKNDALSRTLETQSSVITELRSQNAQMLSDMQEQIEHLSKREDVFSHAVEVQTAVYEERQHHNKEVGNEVAEIRSKVSDIAALHESQEALYSEIRKSLASDADKIRYLSRRIGTLEGQCRSGVPSENAKAPISEKMDNLQGKTEADMFYHDFEQRFRGSFEDIRSRLDVYKPILTELLGTFEGKRFVDLGCGRGEMLEFLCSNGGENCVGVDVNSVQLGMCMDKGYETIEQDCVTYLSGLKDESVDLISAIQVVEHLPFEELKKLFAECERVLKKGGLILFETPNCKNLITASAWFYVDPTHSRPLPPELLHYLAENYGFGDIRIVYANPAIYSNKLANCPENDEISRIINENTDQLNELLFGPQDYALIGVKK